MDLVVDMATEEEATLPTEVAPLTGGAAAVVDLTVIAVDEADTPTRGTNTILLGEEATDTRRVGMIDLMTWVSRDRTDR